jgi:hypothetical protein
VLSLLIFAHQNSHIKFALANQKQCVTLQTMNEDNPTAAPTTAPKPASVAPYTGDVYAPSGVLMRKLATFAIANLNNIKDPAVKAWATEAKRIRFHEGT